MKSFNIVFPGQGSQHPGMGKEIYNNFKIAQLAYEEASDALKLNLKKLCFDGDESELKLTANTQPALLITSVAMWRVFQKEFEGKPQAGLGHSLGEYSALVAAGSLTLSEAIVGVRVRGLAMQEAVPVGAGGMTAVLGLDDDKVVKACSDLQKKAATDGGLRDCILEAANFNSPGQVVIGGHQKALDYFKEHFIPGDYGATRVKLIPLAVSAPFHSSLMRPAAEKLKLQLEKIKWNKELGFDVIHNVNAEANRDGMKVKTFLYDQMTKPVLWTSSIRTTLTAATNHFVEIGAGRVLAALIKKIEPGSHTHHIDTIDGLKKTMAVLAEGETNEF